MSPLPPALSRVLRLFLSAFLLAVPGFARDWTVDDDGNASGADFSDIQAAIDAAGEGDTILLHAGEYPEFLLDGKGLNLVALEPGVRVLSIASPTTIRNVGASSFVNVSGVAFSGQQLFTLRLDLNSGPVWFDGCNFNGNSPDCGCGASGGRGVRCYLSSDVGFLRCVFRGGNGDLGSCDYGQPGLAGGKAGDGLRAITSRVEFHECYLRGGIGGKPCLSHVPAGSSAPAVTACDNSVIHAFRSTFLGRPHTGLPTCSQPIEFDETVVVRQFESQFHTPDCHHSLPLEFPTLGAGAFCFGTPGACPCSNPGGGGAGCRNSHGRGGELSATGVASVLADTLTLRHEGLRPGTPMLFFQGEGAENGGFGIPFGDGLLCASGPTIRLATRIAPAQTALLGFGVPGDLPISVRGDVPGPGTTRFYQVWYREPENACSAGPFSTSNGLEIAWAP